MEDEKTETVLIMNPRRKNTGMVEVVGHRVISKQAIKYLGVLIDAKLTCRRHLEYACRKQVVPSQPFHIVGWTRAETLLEIASS